MALTCSKDLPLFDGLSTALPKLYPYKLHDHKIKSYRGLLGASYYLIFCLLVECRLAGIFILFRIYFSYDVYLKKTHRGVHKVKNVICEWEQKRNSTENNLSRCSVDLEEG